MKYFLGLFILTAVFSFRFPDDIYSISLKAINGGKIELSQFRGKKMLFVVLPTTAGDTSVSIHDLSELQTKYKSSLVIIGIPAQEYGFAAGDEGKLQQLYRNEARDTSGAVNFIIADGMKVKKGSDQSALFQWLTDKNKNRHFNQDVRGVGNKFFVDERGELYAVLGAQLKLTSPLMDKVLTRQAAKKQ